MERIPTPRIGEFLLQEFMIPMNLTAHAISEGAKIPLEMVSALLSDYCKVTPEISEKLGKFFGMSPMWFYRIQRDIDARQLTSLKTKYT